MSEQLNGVSLLPTVSRYRCWTPLVTVSRAPPME